jgi:hypothetical protein
MTAARKLFAGLLAAVALAPGLALADYAATASGNGYSYWALEGTQADANWEALKKCNERTPKKDCRVQVTKAVVKVVNPADGIIGYVPTEDSVADAKAHALKKCGSSSCKIDLVMNTPGFWALAVSKNKDGKHKQYLSSGHTDLVKAREDAVAGCQKMSDFQCEIVWAGAVPGEVKP